MADWSSYFARIKGQPISIAVDLALREQVPLPGKPTAYAKLDTTDPFKITEMRLALTTLAEEFGGDYSGWSTTVQN